MDLSEGQADLSPQIVAEYLLISGDFKGFNLALNELTANKLVRNIQGNVKGEKDRLIVIVFILVDGRRGRHIQERGRSRIRSPPH